MVSVIPHTSLSFGLGLIFGGYNVAGLMYSLISRLQSLLQLLL